MAIINGKSGATVYGTRDADEIYLSGKSVAYGGTGNDSIYGSEADNRLHGQDGDDEIFTGDGGRDSVWGGRGNDTIIAQYSTSATVYGEGGNDGIYGSFGNDVIDGGAGNDWMSNWGGRDSLRGGTGDDDIGWLDDEDNSVSGVSQYSGGAGHDTLGVYVLGDGIDAVEITVTGEGKGTLSYQSTLPAQAGLKMTFTGINEIDAGGFGVEGTPLIYHGGTSDMTLTGSIRDDTLIGGAGDETFTGGYGDDSFIFDFRPFSSGGMGYDRIIDFSLDPDWGVDTLEFRGGDGRMTTTKTEHDGMTTYTSTDNAGHTIHILDVLGLPLPDDTLLG